MSGNKTVISSISILIILTAACSSQSNNSVAIATTTSQTQPQLSTNESSVFSSVESAKEEVKLVSIVVSFEAGNGTGTITISGDSSPVAAWFADQPGEVSLDLVDADVEDERSVVEELVSFWFFRDGDSGDVPPSVSVSTSGEIADSVGTSYVVEAQGLPPAPGTETTTTTSPPAPSTTTTTSTVPSETPEPSLPPTTTSPTTTTPTPATTEAPAPVVLQVQVLNGSGVTGAAGSLTNKLSRAGFVVLPAGNAPRRYSTSAVCYAEGWQTEAAEILAEAGIEEIEEPTAMPQRFATPEVAVVVLLGTDTAPATARAQAGLRPRQRNDVMLPLGDDVPRDRYVPGLANINIYSQINDQGSLDLQAKLQELSIFMRYVGNYQPYLSATAENIDTNGTFREVAKLIEDTLLWMGFTPQNVCGAPAGYSFTDLLQLTHEWDEDLQNYININTTDRLLELHGGERINPEANLDFYIQQAVQTMHDQSQLHFRTPQMILCMAWKVPPNHLRNLAGNYLSLLSFRRNQMPGGFAELHSQNTTYHLKAISRNGNLAYVVVCTYFNDDRYVDTESSFMLWWRNAGYRAEGIFMKWHPLTTVKQSSKYTMIILTG